MFKLIFTFINIVSAINFIQINDKTQCVCIFIWQLSPCVECAEFSNYFLIGLTLSVPLNAQLHSCSIAFAVFFPSLSFILHAASKSSFRACIQTHKYLLIFLHVVVCCLLSVCRQAADRRMQNAYLICASDSENILRRNEILNAKRIVDNISR